jgi:GrpB-like predicted nucleotidyltransferase (UPF0157 family)
VPDNPAVATLSPHRSEWARRFRREEQRVAAVLGERAVAIEHVGSTSVPDLHARPIVDVLVGLRGPAPLPEELEALRAVGYERVRRREGRLYLSRGKPRAVTLHFAQWGSPRWFRLIDFRDALRSDAGARARYAELKRRLEPAGPGGYAEAKRRFVEAELQRLGLERRRPHIGSRTLRATEVERQSDQRRGRTQTLNVDPTLKTVSLYTPGATTR